MKEKINAIEVKVDELVGRLEKLSQANKELSSDNLDLKNELSRLKKQLKDSQLGSGDTNEAVKRRLTSVLDRLDELEALVN
ncbi:MAG TPA: hypothetical protein VHP63_06960 [candidate division Zixibacteria bacterium]|nr:hypothetical protein [candidate division Zixibacteria bacterium]